MDEVEFRALKLYLYNYQVPLKVGDTIASSKTAEYTGIMDCIGCVNIHNLETHIKCSTFISLSPPIFIHTSLGWYKPFMPGKPASPATMIFKSWSIDESEALKTSELPLLHAFIISYRLRSLNIFQGLCCQYLSWTNLNGW